MTTYKNELSKDQRLVILRSMNELGNTANDSMLHTVLEQYGHNVSRDKVRTEARWLEEQGLIAIKDINGVLVCTLTARGQDVALGRATVDGVKRPSPKA